MGQVTQLLSGVGGGMEGREGGWEGGGEEDIHEKPWEEKGEGNLQVGLLSNSSREHLTGKMKRVFGVCAK